MSPGVSSKNTYFFHLFYRICSFWFETKAANRISFFFYLSWLQTKCNCFQFCVPQNYHPYTNLFQINTGYSCNISKSLGQCQKYPNKKYFIVQYCCFMYFF